MKNLSRRNFLASGLAMLAGCKNDDYDPKRVSMKVSESYYFRFQQEITYCGVLGQQFSLCHSSSNSAVNYFYPLDSKEINFNGRKYQVISVDTNQITLEGPLKVR